MLSLLAGNPERRVDVHIEAQAGPSRLSSSYEGSWSVAFPAPDLGASWKRMSSACGWTCRAVQNTLRDDMDSLTTMFSEWEEAEEAEGRREGEPSEGLPDPDSWLVEQDPDDCYDLPGSCTWLARPRLKSGLPSNRDDASVAVIADRPVPQIVITPCPTEPRDPSCLVPFQDSLFNTRLTVPNHPVVNSVFPPLLPERSVSQRPLRAVEMWRYERGHWRAVLPSVEEQARRGLFSRGTRAKACTPRRRTRGHGR